MLNDPQVKLVVVCTHADSHFEYAKRALEAGKKTYWSKKPFTPTLAEAKAPVYAGEKQRVDGDALPEPPLRFLFPDHQKGD